jgi:hypothetical protein
MIKKKDRAPAGRAFTYQASPRHVPVTCPRPHPGSFTAVERTDEEILQNISNADVLFRRLLDNGHSTSGSLVSVKEAATELKWPLNKATEAAYLLYGRQWLEVQPPTVFDYRSSTTHTRAPDFFMRLSPEGSAQASREMAARAQSLELARLETEAKRARRWTMVCMILLGISLMVNLLLWLRPF